MRHSFNKGDTLEESKYRSYDLRAKVIGFIISILLAVVGWNQFSTQNEKQFQSHYYEEKIKYINKVIELVERVYLVESETEKIEIAQKIWAIHYGYGMVYFSYELNESLDNLKKYVNKCYQKFDRAKDYNVKCEEEMMFYLAEFSIAAREELAQGWDIDFSNEIGHPWRPNDA